MRPGFPHEMAPSSSSVEHSSTWHSPVPYLFGGLAAMLGLIAFALLILACSYWRLSGFLDDDQDQHHHASSSNNNDNSSATAATSKPTPYLEEGFVVIMAGDDKPTFLATPVTARPSPFGLGTTTGTSTSIAGGKVTGGEPAEEEGKLRGDGTHQHQ
ncbi:protein GLUTAMINE DUMPER 5 [Iris pallida]|uniref:Protein GLUTAMINE DUMPER 5 n=1 Tax=Iris pallida TaxID=29817 RepID=A0AAX6GKM4_IRIPA|nr:protein GLUTAMINE DUMPER 5 [Iris pallida]